MNWRLVFRLTWRWTVISSATIALFWLIWYMTVGAVPAEYLTRWADILIGPIWSFSGVILFGFLMSTDDETAAAAWFIIMMGWAFSLLVAFVYGLVTGLMVMGSVAGIVLILGICTVLLWTLIYRIVRLPGFMPLCRWLGGR